MARRPAQPSLPAAPPPAPLPPNAARLWDVLDGNYRLAAGGSLLDRAAVARLVDAAAQQFGLERIHTARVIQTYLTTFVLRHTDRVIWDTQRQPLLAALHAAAIRLAEEARNL